jgi:hypothetical protein
MKNLEIYRKINCNRERLKAWKNYIGKYNKLTEVLKI